nr:olfactory receptor [Apolygus lucorum]
MIAISLLALMSGDGKSSVLLRAALMVVAEVLYLALVCGQSESVQELGESLHEELYNMNWLDLDTPAKKTIMIMIEQSKRPLVLTAAGLQPLNWEAFTRVMNTAYTYVNLLLAANA